LANTPKQSAAILAPILAPILAGAGTGFVFCVKMDSRASQCAELEFSRRGSDHCDRY